MKEFHFFKKGRPGWGANQGCQMVCFQTKNPKLGNFGGPWNEKVGIFYGRLEYITAFFIFYRHLAIYIVAVWYSFPRFGILNKEKSGNPGANPGSFDLFYFLIPSFCRRATAAPLKKNS
jgi:hypothetical protein